MQRLAVFDLDGTITRHDTLLPYAMGYVLRHPLRLPRLLGALPALLGYLLGKHDRGHLKGALIRASLGGVSRTQIGAWTAAFVPPLLARGTFHDARRTIEVHRRDGDILLLMSASPDLYVPAIAGELGFERAICTQVLWKAGRLDGRLAGHNCRDAEKLRQLHALREQHPAAQIVAYGNSSADLPHLLHADDGVVVNGSRRCNAAAQAGGLRIVRWS